MIERVQMTKCLVYHLTREHHINHCVTRYQLSNRYLCSQHVLAHKHLVLLYNSLMQRYIQYGILLSEAI